MKNVKLVLLLVLISSAYCLAVSQGDAWDNDKPGDQQVWNTAALSIRNNNDALEAVLGVDLVDIPLSNYVFNVKSPTFGAIGNDSNDDTAAVQAAIDAAESNGSGTVFFPDGIYLVEGLTCTGSNIIFKGASERARLKNKNAGSIDMLTVSGSVLFVEIRDLLFDGNTQSGTGDAIVLKGVTSCNLTNVHIIDMGGVGLKFETSVITCSLRNLFITGCASHGIHFVSGVAANNNVFISGRISGNGGAGLFAEAGTQNTFIGTDFESNSGGGVHINTAVVRSVSLIDCWIESNSGNTAQILIEGGTVGNSIWNCQFSGLAATEYFIKVDDADSTRIIGNRLTANARNVWLTSNADDTVYEQHIGNSDVYIRDESTSTRCRFIDTRSLTHYNETILNETINGYSTYYGGLAPESQNLFLQSSFVSANFTDRGLAVAAVVAVDSADGVYDLTSLEITFGTGAGAADAVSDNGVATTPEKNFWVSFKAKASVNSYHQITLRSTIGVAGAVHGDRNLALTTEWKYFAFLFAANAADEGGDTRIHFIKTGTDAISPALVINIDDLQIETTTDDVVMPTSYIPTKAAALIQPAGLRTWGVLSTGGGAGTVDMTGGSGTKAIAFEKDMPDTNYRIMLAGDASETFFWDTKATTGFNIKSSNSSSTANVDWFAVYGGP